ncbi:putative two-component sensor [Caenispirillum salinarum AK4]|uniref:histidine kinase n=1 Tax=Caenispirillum salinarum AK4 TaxID=1238182 RepID=K9HDU7_9PROT|nr:NahK/ErcS family hybrid sensor histidine kinase/response regulator [Caenispirillum salinarum]EKV28638.1 putative two-component sensor [Caenispirillum salinarum AK4]
MAADGDPKTAVTAEDRIAALEHENAKLRKINKVLMDRVERSMDYQGNAFSLFQTAIVLENRIRERTQALEKALRELERTNRDLSIAKDQAESAQTLLREAIETISEGFILCDADDRVVLLNTKFRLLWPGLSDHIHPGMPFSEVARRALELDIVEVMDSAPGGRPTVETAGDWLRFRMRQHRDPGEPIVVKLTNGTWIQINERPTKDGGIVGIYTDITQIKVAEARQRERELAEKSVLLQATLDTITQGISVFDGGFRLVAWNEGFSKLLDIDPETVALHAGLEKFLRNPTIRAQLLVDDDPETWRDSLDLPAVLEHRTSSGRVLEVRRNPMPGGGFVSTYTDITARKRSEEALRDSERRLRLITDAMPALIAYVDADRRYRFTNRGYEDWFGRPRDEINGREMDEALGPTLYRLRKPYVDRALAGEPVTFEMHLPTEESSIEYAHATYVPHVARSGEVLGFFALIQDITERRRAAEALREAKETLEIRVEERTRALTTLNEELRHAKAEAEQANLSKTKFLAAASHDLLQPLNAARVFAGALQDRRMSGPNRELLNNVTAALEAVDELLSALLEISRLDAGVLTTDVRDFPIADLMATLAAEHAPLAQARGLTLRHVPRSCVVRTDQQLLSRVMRNFLSNALRYTAEGRILLGCRRHRDGLLVGVWDTGIGIPEDKQREIFEEFRRLRANPDRRGDNGVGLGLAIVERIARRMGHQIVVRSRPGKGSFFGIIVPRGDRAAVPVVRRTAPTRARDRVAGATVAVIDNETSILAGMAALLKGWHCKPVTAVDTDGLLAAVDAAGVVPDIIIADYHLADDAIGLDSAAALRAHLGRRIPTIVITADRTEDIAKAVRDRGWHLMTKPARPARLRSLLAHLLAGGGVGGEGDG